MTIQRRSPRKSMTYYVSIFDRTTNTFVGHLANLSKCGMKITSTKPLQPNMEYSFGLVDTNILKGANQIGFEATSRWSTKTDDDFFDTGFEFSNISPEAAEMFELYG